MLIENCHNYGFDYGVYPGTNSANPEYLIVRAPAIKGFVLRGTGSTDGNANQNFTFYTSADGENWKEFKDYTKTTDTSVSGSCRMTQTISRLHIRPEIHGSSI